jgi:Cu(I)/Ag(I) efflux system protein CusF
MKTTSLMLIATCAISASVFAQTGAMKSDDAKAMHGMEMKPGMDMKGMDMGSMKNSKTPANAEMHVAEGTVKAVDPAGKVTIQHGPVKTLGWPAMTMGFSVKDKALMNKLVVGSKVQVAFMKQGGDYVIESVK